MAAKSSVRDQAIIWVLFQACMRRSEAAALEWRDVEDAPGGLRIRVRKSKTNQDGVLDIRFVDLVPCVIRPPPIELAEGGRSSASWIAARTLQPPRPRVRRLSLVVLSSFDGGIRGPRRNRADSVRLAQAFVVFVHPRSLRPTPRSIPAARDSFRKRQSAVVRRRAFDDVRRAATATAAAATAAVGNRRRCSACDGGACAACAAASA